MSKQVDMVPLLEAVVSYVNEGVLIANKQGDVLFQNPAAIELLNATNSRPLQQLKDLQGFNLKKALVKAAIDAGEADAAGRPSRNFVSFEEQLNDKGQHRHLEFHSGIVECPRNGEDLRLVLIRDRTDQRKLESVYLSLNTDFETSDASMLDVIERIKQIAPTNAFVLLQGESGTGKTHLARMIHGLSSRSRYPFVEVNCAAIPETLIESELFGHIKGAFTGATHDRPGRFQSAHKGTLFLDEISEIPMHLQAKLLRALQDQQFEMVGSDESVKVDVRIIAASNRDLHELASDGEFRPDLYYRLAVIPLTIPSLRERKGDIPRLIQHFLNRMSDNGYPGDIRCNKDALEMLISYTWPGNVRELENAIEHGIICAQDNVITPESLPNHIYNQKAENGFQYNNDDIHEQGLRQQIKDALIKTGGNKAAAASMLGIDRTTLWRRMQKLHIS